MSADRDADLLALDDALTQLAVTDPRKSQLVELKYFELRLFFLDRRCA